MLLTDTNGAIKELDNQLVVYVEAYKRTFDAYKTSSVENSRNLLMMLQQLNDQIQDLIQKLYEALKNDSANVNIDQMKADLNELNYHIIKNGFKIKTLLLGREYPPGDAAGGGSCGSGSGSFGPGSGSYIPGYRPNPRNYDENVDLNGQLESIILKRTASTYYMFLYLIIVVLMGFIFFRVVMAEDSQPYELTLLVLALIILLYLIRNTIYSVLSVFSGLFKNVIY